MKLYEINDAIRCALDTVQIDEETGEITGAEALHEVEALANDKVEATALYLRESDAEIEAVKKEIDRLTARVKSATKKNDYIKSMLLDALHATGKVKTARVTVCIRKSHAVEIEANTPLPDAYQTVKTTVAPNKIAIKKALSEGVEIAGCSLVERESVSIR